MNLEEGRWDIYKLIPSKKKILIDRQRTSLLRRKQLVVTGVTASNVVIPDRKVTT